MPETRSKLDVNHALKLATVDKTFAQALIKRPEDFKKAFNLRDEEIKAIKGALPSDLTTAFEYY